jgi:hypothetical protein
LSLSAGPCSSWLIKPSLTTALRTGSCPGTQIPPCPEPADAVVGALCRAAVMEALDGPGSIAGLLRCRYGHLPGDR